MLVLLCSVEWDNGPLELLSYCSNFPDKNFLILLPVCFYVAFLLPLKSILSHLLPALNFQSLFVRFDLKQAFIWGRMKSGILFWS